VLGREFEVAFPGPIRQHAHQLVEVPTWLDGVNVRDYIANTDTEWWGGDATLAETLRDHNCLTSQDNN
jgi:hypothetical protein